MPGCVTNFQELVATEVHKSIKVAMGLQRQSMMEAGDTHPHPLLSDWSNRELSFLDVIMFCFLAARRLQQKKPWKGARQALVKPSCSGDGLLALLTLSLILSRATISHSMTSACRPGH